jgi:hypothetical protein
LGRLFCITIIIALKAKRLPRKTVRFEFNRSTKKHRDIGLPKDQYERHRWGWFHLKAARQSRFYKMRKQPKGHLTKEMAFGFALV